jgi:hypothetical protein
MTLVLDSPTERTVFESMSIEQQEAYLESIRERRLASLKVYEELQATKKAAANEKMSAKIDRLAKKMSKQLEAVEKAMLAVEACHRDVRAIRILMETEA